MKKDIVAFYSEKYPDIASARAPDIQKLVDVVTGIYDQNVFPEMQVSWKTYPSNMGHRNSPGCFRCHDGQAPHAGGQGALLRMLRFATPSRARGPQTGLGEPDDQCGQGLAPVADARETPGHREAQGDPVLRVPRRGAAPRETECNECHGH